MAKTSAEMVATLEALLAESAGVKSVTVDGIQTVFDRAQLLKELDYHKAEVAKVAGNRPMSSRIDLS